jgi:hypothetical protein
MDKIGFSFLGYTNPSLRQATFAITVGATMSITITQFVKFGMFSDGAGDLVLGPVTPNLRKRLMLLLLLGRTLRSSPRKRVGT